jgi:hypothetical protein
MAGIDSISQGNRPLLRLSYAGEDEAQPARLAAREQQLARALDKRLSSQLDRIRARLESEPTPAPDAPNPPGAGRRLDILA